MKKLMCLIFITYVSAYSMSDDSESQLFYYPPQTPCIALPAAADTIVKPEPLEVHHTLIPTPYNASLQNVVVKEELLEEQHSILPHSNDPDLKDVIVKSEPIEQAAPTPSAIASALSFLGYRAPTTIKEDSQSDRSVLATRRKKIRSALDRAWNPRTGIEPSRIPGKHRCPHPGCRAVLRYSWGLKQHENRVHGNPARWGCPFFYHAAKPCKTTFVTNSDYRRHLKIKHYTTHELVQKRELAAPDQQPNQPTSLNEIVRSLASRSRPHTRSITRMLNSAQKD